MRLEWYALRLLLHCGRRVDLNQAAADVLEEITFRPHLRRPRVAPADSGHALVVAIETEAPSREDALAGMAEELFEIGAAVLSDVEGMRVEPLDAAT